MTEQGGQAKRTPRDPRLDFFRGLGMYIIYIAHTPGNFLKQWIPARFGFSDATEIFVFCSGMASALAFATVFTRRGWWMGAARVLFRVWQVYWAHIAVFFVIAALVVVATAGLPIDKNYVTGLNLQHFFNDPTTNLIGLLTLTYVPNYFDILPMYLVILALMPIVMLLGRFTPWAAIAFVITLWIMASLRMLDLPAEPWSERTWFFNPFAWQLVFFTGFGFGVGWLKAPPINRNLIIAALIIVLVTIPFAYFRILREFPELMAIRRSLRDVAIPFTDFSINLTTKTRFGIFRYIHFLALAYLAYAAAGDGGHRLMGSAAWNRAVAVVRKVGQQSLAVFLAGLVLARISGMVLDMIDGGKVAAVVITLIACVILTGIAYLVAWFKGQPWRRDPGPEKVAAPQRVETYRAAQAPAPGE